LSGGLSLFEAEARLAAQLAAVVVVGFFGRSVANRLAGSLSAMERAVIATIFGLATVVVPLQVLGFAGLLSERWIALLVLLLLIAGALLTVGSTPPATRQRRARAGMLMTPIGMAGAILIPVGGGALMAVPVDWDGLTYHLLLPAQYLQEGRIFPLEPGRPLDLVSFYPQNAELSFAFLMAIARSDLLVTASMVFWTAMAGVVTLLLARDLGAKPASASVAGALSASVPALVSRAASSYVEPLLVFTTVAAILFGRRVLLATSRRERAVCSLLSGLAAGIAAGTKLTGLPFAALLGLLLLLGLALTPRSQSRMGPLWIWLAGCAAPSASWYLRNFLVKGNPLYPAPLAGLPYLERIDLKWEGASVWARRADLAGRDLFGDALFALPPNRSASMTLGSVAPLALGLGAIAVAIAASGFVARIRSRQRGVAVAALIAPAACLALAVTWLATPFWFNIGWFRSQVRLAVPALAVAYALSAMVVERLRPSGGWIAGLGTLAVSLQVAQSGVLKRFEVSAALVGAAVVASTLVASGGALRSLFERRGLRVLAGCVAFAVLLVAQGEREKNRSVTWLASPQREPLARAALEVGELVPERATLAFVADVNYEFLYLLHGSRFDRRVLIEPDPPAALSPDGLTREQWLARLCARGVELLVVSRWLSGREEWPKAEIFAREGGWQLVWESESIRILRPPPNRLTTAF